MSSTSSVAVVYLKPGSVEVQKIDFDIEHPEEKTIESRRHFSGRNENICGSSDQHDGRVGRQDGAAGMGVGHEMSPAK